MKKLILFLLIAFSFANIYSQQTKGYVLQDTKNNKIYYLKKGTEIKIQKTDSSFYGYLDAISNDELLYSNNKKLPLSDIVSIKFKEKSKLKKWTKISLRLFEIGLASVLLGYFLVLIIGLNIGAIFSLLGIFLLLTLIPVLIYTLILSLSKTKISITL